MCRLRVGPFRLWSDPLSAFWVARVEVTPQIVHYIRLSLCVRGCIMSMPLSRVHYNLLRIPLPRIPSPFRGLSLVTSKISTRLQIKWCLNWLPLLLNKVTSHGTGNPGYYSRRFYNLQNHSIPFLLILFCSITRIH